MTGSYIAARPKYLKPDFFNEKYSNPKTSSDNKELYFNIGRGALKFLITCLSEYYKKQLVIGIQDFNCRVVLDASLQAKAKVFLLDVKLDDFSVDIKELQNAADKIDLLLLTHYQGIPNFQYPEIIAFCKSNNIIVIEDIAQTEGSFYKDIEVGSLGDYAIRSFAFDKPFSVFMGGSLVLNNTSDEPLITLLTQRFKTLSCEKERRAKRDIKNLRFLMDNSKPENYQKGINNHSLLHLYSIFFSNKQKKRLLKVKRINKYMNFLLKLFYDKKIIEKRMHPIKIALIQKQINSFKPDHTGLDYIEKYAMKNNIQIVQNSNVKICWNKYSILDNEQKIKPWVNNMKIEAGNFNWPKTLHTFTNKNILNSDQDFKNSIIAAKYIVNIPNWFDSNKLKLEYE